MATRAKEKRSQPSPLVSNHLQRSDASYSKKKPRKKSRQDKEDLAEERRLTALLFGTGTGTSNDDDIVTEDDNSDKQVEKIKAISEPDTLLFQLDRTGEEDEDVNHDQSDNESASATEQNHSTVAWQDEDDDDVRVNLMNGASRLRKLRSSKGEDVSNITGTDYQERLHQVYKSSSGAVSNTSWAELKQEKQHSSTSASSMLDTTSNNKVFPPTTLNVVRCRDANQSDPSHAALQAVHFFPSQQQNLLLTAGLDKTLRFFALSDNPNKEPSTKIHGIHFPRLPIYSAQFLGDSGKVVVSGRRPFYYMVDVVSGALDCIPRIRGRSERSLEKLTSSPDGKWIAFVGNDGYVLLVHAHTQQLVAELKLNGSVRAIGFTPDSQYIYASGSDGMVYKFDVSTKSCVERFSNQDGTVTSTLAVSHNRLAAGAESGVVNLYSGGVHERIKSILNLQTSVDGLRFNHDGNILALASKRESDSLKLLHVPTATVFSNWPTTKTPLNYVWSMDFSPTSQYLAVANDKGKCLLYNMVHYNNHTV